MTDAASDVPASHAASETGASRHASMLEDGILAGIIGAAVVAVWFLVLDFSRGQPFYTPSLLGNALLLGSSAQEVASVNFVMVLAYTGAHGVLFLMAGVATSWMFHQFEKNPQLGLVLLLLFVTFESVLFGFEVAVVPGLVGALGAFAVALANLLSAAAMFWFLLRRHPAALAHLRQAWHE